jgi:hypothetical protein
MESGLPDRHKNGYEYGMDHVERLIAAFSAEPTAPVFRKLDVLLALEQLRDPRAVPFLLQEVRNRTEPTEIRMRAIRVLRTVRCPSEARAAVGRELTTLLVDRATPDLRIAAALTLADFTDLPGVPAALGAVALDASESLDLRYSAFTSLERVGPTAECVALLGRLADDDAFGRSAQSLLTRWQLA